MKNNLHHYVYRITNLITNKHYYGSRTSKLTPINDLGKIYFSSSSNKDFILDQKLNNQNYKYVIVRIFSNRTEALSFEIYLHNKFDVGRNVKFYNKSQQTSTGFLYGSLGKTKDKNIRNKTINEFGDTLYSLSAKKGSITKQNTILDNGLNIHQVAAKKYKERLDIIKDGETMSTRDKLKQPKKDKTNYQQESEHINIYNNFDELIYEVRINLRKFCKEHQLPYTELYKSKKESSKLYQNITNNRVLSILKNKNYYKYLGWYAIKL